MWLLLLSLSQAREEEARQVGSLISVSGHEDTERGKQTDKPSEKPYGVTTGRSKLNLKEKIVKVI